MANLTQRRIADLDCHIITSEGPPQLLAIFCHGYGAPGEDLVPIGAHLLRSFPSLLDHVQMVFPCAPLSLEGMGIPGGRAWWPLDLERLTRTVELRRYDDLRRDVPAQLETAREKLTALVQVLLEETGLPYARLILGGFSQGAMLATDVALRLPSPPGGLVIWSGTLLNEDDWTQRAPALLSVPVVQSHGRDDAILPYEPATWLRDLLHGAGAKVKFIGFRGPHTIPLEAIQAAGQLCEDLLHAGA
jgi:phospholipase/carboxylesterase